MLSVVDEFTRECLTIEIARKFTGHRVVEVLEELFAIRGLRVSPTYFVRVLLVRIYDRLSSECSKSPLNSRVKEPFCVSF